MRLIVICGATATGKSDLAVSLAQEINAEVINADSMQLYKGMDIGTAKITMVIMLMSPGAEIHWRQVTRTLCVTLLIHFAGGLR